MSNHFRISRKEKAADEYFIDLHEFPSSSELGAIFHVLDIVNVSDSIVIKIGSNEGGILETAVKLINNIRLCKANSITVVVDSVCYSAASIFVIAMLNLGFNVRFMPNVYLMFHDYSGEDEGKGSEVVLAVHNSQEWVKEIYINYCYPFLNKAEINKIMQGKDLYVNFEDINKRLAKINNA